MDALRADLSLPLRSFELELTLEVAAGETLALVGPSGAGKTTMLRAIAGLARPARGLIACGETWFDSAKRIDHAPEQRSVGFVFQDYALFPHLSVERNVAFAAPSDKVSLGLLGMFDPARLLQLEAGEV